ncbi:MAG: YraN family protein [Balneolales bacterium]|nr:YraN family protein [Balneolales bacterium]
MKKQLPDHIKLGKKGEDIAVRWLEEQEIRILERNYHFEKAEVDIIAYNGRQIIFIEVKTRSSNQFAEPEDAVTKEKKASLYKAAGAWLYERKMEGSPIRFDIISVVLPKSTGTPEIKLFEGVFWQL